MKKQFNRDNYLAKSQNDQLDVETVIDIEELLPGFETWDKALRESSKRQKCLKSRTTKKSHNLAIKLNDCSAENTCSSAACPLCFREYRMSIISAVLRLAKQYSDCKSVTLVFYDDAMKSKDISKDKIEKLKNKLSKQLKRIGIQGPVVGSFEMDYHEDIGRWMPHFHLLMLDQPTEFKILRTYMKRHINLGVRKGVKNRPMLSQRIKNHPKQISYLFKSYWKLVVPYIGYDGKRKTNKRRLKSIEHAKSLRTLDELGFKGLLFLYGVRRSGPWFDVTLSVRN